LSCCTTSSPTPQASHLLKYDSTLGKFDADVKVVDDQHIAVNGKSIRVVSSRDPTKLPWKEMEIDLVIEGTGVFIDTPGASKHIEVRGGQDCRACSRICACLGC
jgi:glyceraldehyde-3-phosphate dehydrogenase (NADP+) (phosphorylating)